MNITIAQNIKKLREKRGLNQAQLAEMLGISDKTVSSWEIGRTEPNMGYVQAMCEIFRVNADTLIYGTDESMYHSAGLDYIRLPLYKNICCGNGGFVDDNIVDYVPVPSQGLDINREHFCMFAQGDSMESMIEDGDLLVFEKTSTPLENSIGAFCIGEDEATCKKYVISNGVVMLKPLNSKYDPILVDIENIRCVGILRKIIRDVE